MIALQQAVLAGLLLAVFFLAVHSCLPQMQPVDLLLDSGRVITMDDMFSIRTAAAIKGA